MGVIITVNHTELIGSYPETCPKILTAVRIGEKIGGLTLAEVNELEELSNDVLQKLADHILSRRNS